MQLLEHGSEHLSDLMAAMRKDLFLEVHIRLADGIENRKFMYLWNEAWRLLGGWLA